MNYSKPILRGAFVAPSTAGCLDFGSYASDVSSCEGGSGYGGNKYCMLGACAMTNNSGDGVGCSPGTAAINVNGKWGCADGGVASCHYADNYQCGYGGDPSNTACAEGSNAQLLS